MPRVLKKKILPSMAQALASGDKTFEIRWNDEGYQKGDVIEFVVADANGTYPQNPLSGKRYLVTYVLNGFGLDNGYVCMAIKPCEADGV